jgi:hypothetical protein
MHHSLFHPLDGHAAESVVIECNLHVALGTMCLKEVRDRADSDVILRDYAIGNVQRKSLAAADWSSVVALLYGNEMALDSGRDGGVRIFSAHFVRACVAGEKIFVVCREPRCSSLSINKNSSDGRNYTFR